MENGFEPDSSTLVYVIQHICGCHSIMIDQREGKSIEIKYEDIKKLVDYITQQRLSVGPNENLKRQIEKRETNAST